MSRELEAIRLAWRGGFDNGELNALHAAGFEHPVGADDWWGRVNRFSLGWLTARLDARLVGFVNLAWDGGAHAFLLDTLVAPDVRREGLATRIVAEAVEQAKAAGCEWLHADFEPHLRGFYLEACGFRPTDAGLIALR